MHNTMNEMKSLKVIVPVVPVLFWVRYRASLFLHRSVSEIQL